jgi:hypothetical protein
VTGGSKLKSILMFRHIALRPPSEPASRLLPISRRLKAQSKPNRNLVGFWFSRKPLPHFATYFGL